jgi:predicted TIM-barrel fold metal-dependent hydrolase
MPLEALARRYPNMGIVQLHCWPFIVEAGWLARHLPNIYIDTCWQPVLNPAFYRRALREWLGYVPTNKIMCAHDSTTVEMAVGSSIFTREILGEELAEFGRSQTLPEDLLMETAAGFLHGNAAALYGMG